MRYLIILLFLTACNSNPKTQATFDRDGDITGGVVMSSKDYAAMMKAKYDSESNKAYYDAQSARYTAMSNDPTAIALDNAINQLGGVDLHPTNSGDVDIALDQGRTQRQGNLIGFGSGLLQWGALGYMGGKAIDALGNRKSGVTIQGDNNEVRGTNTGEYGRASYVEQTAPYGGIPLNPGEVGPIVLGSPEPEEDEVEESPESGGVCDETDDRIILDGIKLPDCSCGSYLAGHCP